MTTSPTISASDRLAVEDVLGRYLWAVDTADIEGVLDTFTPDAIVSYGDGRRYEGSDGLEEFARRAIGDVTARGRMHLSRTLFAERIGDAILLRSYVVVPQCTKRGDPISITTIRYTEDLLRKTPEGWRICHRSIHAWDGSQLSSARAGQRTAGQ